MPNCKDCEKFIDEKCTCQRRLLCVKCNKQLCMWCNGTEYQCGTMKYYNWKEGPVCTEYAFKSTLEKK